MSRITVKGQVTIPKAVRDALGLSPGDEVTFDVNTNGAVVIRRATPAKSARQPDRFEGARGTAQIKWSTDELMALLRGTD